MLKKKNHNLLSLCPKNSKAVTTLAFGALLFSNDIVKAEEFQKESVNLEPVIESQTNFVGVLEESQQQVSEISASIAIQESFIGEIASVIENKSEVVKEVQQYSDSSQTSAIPSVETVALENQLASEQTKLVETNQEISIKKENIENLQDQIESTDSKISSLAEQVSSPTPSGDIESIKEDLKKTEFTIKEKENLLSQKESELSENEVKINDSSSETKKAQNEVNKYDSREEETKKKFDLIQKNLSEQKDKKSVYQNQINESKRDTTSAKNVLPINNKFTDILQKSLKEKSHSSYFRLDGLGRDILHQEYNLPKTGNLEEFYTIQRASIGEFSQKEHETFVNPNHLTQKEKIDLAKFIASALNPLRDSLGLPLLEVDEDLMRVSEEVTRLSKSFVGHDMEALATVSRNIIARNQYFLENGTLVQFPGGNVLKEVEGYILSEGDKISMAEFKKQILWKLIGMIYYDNHADWDHTRVLLNPNTTSFGIAFNADPNKYHLSNHLYTEFRLNTISNKLYPFTNFSRTTHKVPLVKATVDVEELERSLQITNNIIERLEKQNEDTLKELANLKESKEVNQRYLLDLEREEIELLRVNKQLKEERTKLEDELRTLKSKKDELVLFLEGALKYKNNRELLLVEIFDLQQEKETLSVLLSNEISDLTRLVEKQKDIQGKITKLEKEIVVLKVTPSNNPVPKNNDSHISHKEEANNKVIESESEEVERENLDLWKHLLKQEESKLDELTEELKQAESNHEKLLGYYGGTSKEIKRENTTKKALESSKKQTVERNEEKLIENTTLVHIAEVPIKKENELKFSMESRAGIDSEENKPELKLKQDKNLPNTNSESKNHSILFGGLLMALVGLSRKRRNKSE